MVRASVSSHANRCLMKRGLRYQVKVLKRSLKPDEHRYPAIDAACLIHLLIRIVSARRPV
jgi:hypothetical protein